MKVDMTPMFIIVNVINAINKVKSNKMLSLVHPCDQQNRGGCNQTCTKSGEEAKCTCRTPDFKVNVDGISCDKGNIFFIY